jgi:hypothetical protein
VGGCPRRRARPRWPSSCCAGAPPIGGVPGPLAVGGQAPRHGRIRGRAAGRGAGRALRAGGARLHALDRAEPPLPDLITQRLLKAALAGRAPAYGADELDALARHCTRQEDAATKVERHARKSAAALLLEDRIGERFEGLVTGAAEKGTWVRVARPTVEGRLVRGAEGLDVGDRVSVTLEAVDVERGFIDFSRR